MPARKGTKSLADTLYGGDDEKQGPHDSSAASTFKTQKAQDFPAPGEKDDDAGTDDWCFRKALSQAYEAGRSGQPYDSVKDLAADGYVFGPNGEHYLREAYQKGTQRMEDQDMPDAAKRKDARI